MSHLSRRSLLKSVGVAITVGIGGQTARCLSAELKSVNHRIEDEFPYDEYITVEVNVKSSVAPLLRVNVQTCGGGKSLTKKLKTEKQKYDFGPFPHHCVGDFNVILDGCFQRKGKDVNM